MNKSKIEWTQYVWNPLKGLCPLDCKLPDGKSYCYARKMYKRFKWNPELTLDEEKFGSCHEPFVGNLALDMVFDRIKSGSKIFLCSTCELFHPKVPKEWRDAIFEVIIRYPYLTFQILTKLPENIDREMPKNVWIGCSITGTKESVVRIFSLPAGKRTFISYEPLLEKPAFIPGDIGWIIVGKLTGHGNKYDPKLEWIEDFVGATRRWKIPLFLKDNLRSIWGENLIQEWPKIS